MTRRQVPNQSIGIMGQPELSYMLLLIKTDWRQTAIPRAESVSD